MTRFAWLQTQTQTLIAAGLLAALAVAAAITGVQLAHLFHTEVATCHTGCGFARQQFASHDNFMNQLLDIVARAAPALIGMFIGAPLIARELETGTYRLAWTQTVSRTRWIVTKLGVGAAVSALLSGLVTLTITWWYRTLDPLESNKYAIFDRRDIVPIGYALFAFAAGALIGLLIRRTVPAMATTLGAFVFARIATATWLRPHLLTAVTRTGTLASGDNFGIASINGGRTAVIAQGSGPPNSWALSSHMTTISGQPATLAERTAFVRQHCPSLMNPPSIAPPAGHHATAVPAPAIDAGQSCINAAAHAFRLSVTYLPADRYWTLQWLETGIFVGLALLCSIGCFWWVTRRAN
jgi:hypothetical protein